MNENGIRNLQIDSHDEISRIKFDFGPHHYLEVKQVKDGEIQFKICSTHHGFTAKASGGLPTELENLIESIREKFPDNRVD